MDSICTLLKTPAFQVGVMVGMALMSAAVLIWKGRTPRFSKEEIEEIL